MALQRPAEAQTAFERALELAPGRMLALQGLAEAAAAAGDARAAEEARGRLAANQRGAAATGTASGGGVE
jgi:hypothetical protein